MKSRIGVCSWSLRPESPADLIGKLQAVDLDCVQLALDPLRTGHWSLARTSGLLRDAGIEIRSGMMAMHGEDYSSLESIRRTGGVRPLEHWPRNLQAAEENAEIAERLGLTLVTFHAGFLAHDRSDPEREVMLQRLRTVVSRFADVGARVGLETGQDSAATVIDALEDLDLLGVGVNFDPANMILYGTEDPIEALSALAPHVLQVHVKDATASAAPGSWGTEVAAGTGDVDWTAFFAMLAKHRIACDLMIEREAGAARVHDINTARTLVQRMLAVGQRREL